MLLFKSKKKGLLSITLLLMAIYAFNNVFLSIILSNLISAATQSSMSMLIKFASIGVAGFGVFTLIGILMVQCKTKLLFTLNLEIKKTFISEIIHRGSTGENYAKQLSFMTNDLKQLETKGIEAEMTMLSLFFSFFFALMTAFFYHFWIALVFFIGSLLPLLVSLLARSSVSQASQQWITTNANYTNRLKDYFIGLETIRTYQVETQIIDKANTAALTMETSLQKMNQRVEMVNQLIYMGVMVFSLLLPFGFGVVSIIQYGVPLATFIAIVQLSNSLRSPSLQIMQHVNAYATVKGIKQRYLAIRNQENEVNTTEVDGFTELSLNDISLAYQAKPLYEHLFLNVKQGEKILIIGPSGSGKSSLLRLIQQTLRPTTGTYLMNGHEITKRSANTFSLIRQQPLIFDESLLYNITLGETFSDVALSTAIEMAQLTEVVQSKGLDYQVGERGMNLSAGELQRIEIARALVRQRPVLLADEMSAALDGDTAKQLRTALLNSPDTFIEVAHNIEPEDYSFYTQVWDLKSF